MRIANIIEEGKLGGPQVRMATVGAALKDQVETVLIIPGENSEKFRNFCDSLSVPYKTFWMSRITKDWRILIRYFIFSPYEILRLAFFFKKENFELIHVSGGSWQYKGIIAGKLAGKKVLWHLNDTSIPWLFKRLFLIFSPLVDGFIYASKRSKKYYGPLINVNNNTSEFIIPAPVNTTKFDPSLSYDTSLSTSYEGKVVIGTVANINPIKGIETFIEMAAILNKKFKNLHFIIVGAIHENQSNYFDNLQNICNNLHVTNIEFVGSHTDVRTFLQLFDIYICSSNAESSPISVWEAMAMKKPIVSTDVGDVPLYVRDSENGFIVDVGDYKSMAKKVSILVCDKGMRKHFGVKSRDVAVSQLNLAVCAKLHYHAYEKTLETR